MQAWEELKINRDKIITASTVDRCLANLKFREKNKRKNPSYLLVLHYFIAKSLRSYFFLTKYIHNSGENLLDVCVEEVKKRKHNNIVPSNLQGLYTN